MTGRAPAFQRLIDDGGLDLAKLEARGIDVQACYEGLVADVTRLAGPRLDRTVARINGMKHGTTTGYANGCRCKACSERHAERRRDERTATRLHKQALEHSNEAA